MIAVISVDDLRTLIREELERIRPQSPEASDLTTLLTTKEAARLAGVQPKTIAGWIRSGRLRASRPGGRQWRLSRSDLDACARGVGSAVDPHDEARKIAASLRR